jgi:hypothetical protein
MIVRRRRLNEHPLRLVFLLSPSSVVHCAFAPGAGRQLGGRPSIVSFGGILRNFFKPSHFVTFCHSDSRRMRSIYLVLADVAQQGGAGQRPGRGDNWVARGSLTTELSTFRADIDIFEPFVSKLSGWLLFAAFIGLGW